MRGPLRIIRVAAFLLIFLLAGYYTATRFLPEAPAPVPAVSDASIALELPDFVLNDLDGNPRNLREWADGPLVVNFWATWCAPCRREMPMLQALHEERRDDELKVIGIAIDRVDDVAAYIPESGVTYPILVGQSDAMDLAYELDPNFAAMPVTVFATSGGQVLTRFVGELHPPELRRILAVLDAVSQGKLRIDAARLELAER